MKQITLTKSPLSLLTKLLSVLLPLLGVLTTTYLLSTPKANAGVKEEILSNMDRAYDSSSAGKHKEAIKSATNVIKLLPKMGPGMEESEFAYYMYSVRAWSKYEINDIKGACADWGKELSLSNKLGDGFETDADEFIKDEC